MHEGSIVDNQDDFPGADMDLLDEVEKELTVAFGNLSATRRADTKSGKLTERRKPTSTIKCYGCVRNGHFKSDCPRLGNWLKRRSAPRPSLECLLCNGNHFVRDCLLLASPKSLLQRETGRDTDSSKFSLPCPSTAYEPSTAFKRNGTAVIPVSAEHAAFPVKLIELPSMSKKIYSWNLWHAAHFCIGSCADSTNLDLCGFRLSLQPHRRIHILSIFISAPDMRLRVYARNRF